jgi:hypothetical protein
VHRRDFLKPGLSVRFGRQGVGHPSDRGKNMTKAKRNDTANLLIAESIGSDGVEDVG